MASPRSRRALRLGGAAAVVGVGLAARLGELPPPAAADCEPDPAAIRLHGGPELALPTQLALERILETRVGARARAILEGRTLRSPVTIELNAHGDHYTPYRIPGEALGETIVFDPWSLPSVDTERGRQPATRETILAHELGHAVFKLRSEAEVIREIENPVREELGLPRRIRF